MHLARDFYTVCENDFPAAQIADHVNKQNLNPSVVNNRLKMIDSARSLTEELEKILRRDKSPLAENPFIKQQQGNEPPVYTQFEKECAQAPGLESDIQKHLTNFSLITHGFGGPAMVAVLNAFKNYLDSMKSSLQKASGIEPSSSSSSSSKNLGYSKQHHHHQQHQQQSAYFTSNNTSSTKNLSALELTSLKVESKD